MFNILMYKTIKKHFYVDFENLTNILFIILVVLKIEIHEIFFNER